VIKAKGEKDAKATVDGKKKRVQVKLVRDRAVVVKPPDQTTKPPTVDCSATIKDPKSKKCIQQYCASHPDDPRCDAE
jgi:hypothetical protein